MRNFIESHWVRIVVPLVLVVVWFAGGAIGGQYFGKLEEVSTNDMTTFLPKSADSTVVNDELMKFRSDDTIPAIVVVESDRKLTPEQKDEISASRESVEREQLASGAISEPVYSSNEKAAFFVIPIDSDSEFDEAIPELQAAVADELTTLEARFTGPAMLSRDLNKAFAGIDGTLLVVALSVVFVILLVVYRSLILPIVTLLGAMLALAVSILVVWILAANDVVLLNGQTQGILFILVIGAATDYALLYIARYREELIRQKTALKATIVAWRASFEPIVAAGGTVALGLMCLLVSDLGSNKALGPIGSIGVAFSVLSALTFLPAVLLLFGRFAFWPRVPKFVSNKRQTDYHSAHPFWAKVGVLVGRHPRRLWVGTVLVLAVACLAIPQFDGAGVSQDNIVLGKSEARDGQAIITKHFAAGSGSATAVLVAEDDMNKVVKLLDDDPGVGSVSVLSTDADNASLPIGASRAEITNEIRAEISKQRKEQIAKLKDQLKTQLAGQPDYVYEAALAAAQARIPSVDELTEKADPFADVAPKVVDGRVIIQATLNQPASSIAARDIVTRIRSDLVHVAPDAKVGGVSAVQLDTNNASEHDLKVVIPLILVAITIVLMLLLRAIVAPIILLFTTVLSFGATIGVSALMFNNVFNFAGADPVVIIFGFVFLVALGIDYNIFLMTRVREETIKLGVRAGTLKALVVTGGVITSAGVVLASTFAALSVIPILFLAQIAFIVAFGVLLDALIVRSLLVPALTLEIGKWMWWPSKLSQKGKK